MDVTQDCTLDGFLDGRITAAQPKRGFRVGHDTVLLAAAVPVGRAVLELGSGSGIASLCYSWRVTDAVVWGIEIDPDLVALASSNAARNGMQERVRFSCGDVCEHALAAERFDHVFFNPPFHFPNGHESPEHLRSVAKHDKGSTIADWTRVAMRAVKEGGTITAILRFDRCDEMLAATDGCAGFLLPLRPRSGGTPKRAIVHLLTGATGAVRHCTGLVLHQDNGGSTGEVEAILRGGAEISFPLESEKPVPAA
jgi:tRNA1(Val) A37 N6-methylase TrmN6